jgi:hypothetical protein
MVGTLKFCVPELPEVAALVGVADMCPVVASTAERVALGRNVSI